MANKIVIPYRSEIISLVLLFGAFFMIKTRIEEVNAKMVTIANNKQEQERCRTLASGVKGALADRNKVLENFLYTDIFAIKKIFQEKAWANDIDMSAISSSQTDKGVVSVGAISGDLKGNYDNILKFIKNLEEANIRINNFRISGYGESRAVSIDTYGFCLKNNE
jgi:hypothetical protein